MVSLGTSRIGLIGAVALTLAVVATSRSRIELVSVQDAAMAPSLLPGQQVLVQQIGDRGLEIGDVVAIRGASAPDVLYLKRLIAGPGDVVQVSDGRTIAVPSGHYFALGDNRAGSFDSHQGWFVAADDLVGRVIVSYWPPAAAGPIRSYSGPEAVAGSFARRP